MMTSSMGGERPVSVASSHKSHKRGASNAVNPNAAEGGQVSAPVTLQGLPTASLFVNNLRLLDFDLLPDWPGITTSTFGNQDARARIRGTEFALFQLFRLYDPMMALEKLQPFFPPLEPLQSINLRAALYRCLNELKKNGVLGKETVLRKSMLDECQGEKFLELCLNFSSTVLRKMTLTRAMKHGRSIAEEMGMAQRLSKSRLGSMLPLAIAHKSALKKILCEKQQKHEIYVRLYNTLIQKEAELQQRKAHAQEHARKRPFTAGLENIAAVQQNLTENIRDHGAIYRVVVNGDDVNRSDGLLTRPFEQVWDDNERDAPLHGNDKADLLEDLERRASDQAKRLRRWQDTHEKLLSEMQAEVKEGASRQAQAQGAVRFDRHQQLTVQDAPVAPATLPDSESNPKATRYDEVLTAMREELRRVRQRAASGPTHSPVIHRAQTTSAVPTRKPSVTLDTPLASRYRDLGPSSSQTAVPVRPPMFSRRVPSRSRSYQQPKVDSQRHHIPFKSEVFSPIKGHRNSISPVSRSASITDSPAGDNDDAESDYERAGNGRPLSLSSEATGTIDSGIGLGIDGDKYFNDNEGVVPNSRPMSMQGPFARASLTDRTRASMEQSRGEGGSPSPSAHSLSPTPNAADGADSPEFSEAEVNLPRISLADRTRQSILRAATPQQRTAPAQLRATQRSQVYPANQFETPIKVIKTRGGSVDQEPMVLVGDKRIHTPQDQLFSPDAEYESVFKTRPKIALSPVVSAQKRPDSGRVSLELSELMLAHNGMASTADVDAE